MNKIFSLSLFRQIPRFARNDVSLGSSMGSNGGEAAVAPPLALTKRLVIPNEVRNLLGHEW